MCVTQVSKTPSIVQYSTGKCFFSCSSHVHTLCDQLKKISFCSCMSWFDLEYWKYTGHFGQVISVIMILRSLLIITVLYIS